MKYFIDGDQLYITRNDFVDLQESPAVFIDTETDLAQRILAFQGFETLSFGEQLYLRLELYGDEPIEKDEKRRWRGLPLNKSIVQYYLETKELP